MISSKSDRTPILLKLNGDRFHFKKRFYFENLWLLELELDSIVEDGWANLEGFDLLAIISCTSVDMEQWGK